MTAWTATLAHNELRKCCVSKYVGVGIVSPFMALIHFNTLLPVCSSAGGEQVWEGLQIPGRDTGIKA